MEIIQEISSLTSQQKDELLHKQAREIIYLKSEIEQLKRAIFGSKSERYVTQNDGQLTLELGQQAQRAETETETQQITINRKKKTDGDTKGHGRAKLPSHLLREEIIIEPEHLEENATKIGESITEILEYTPGKLYVKKYVRPKYVHKSFEGVKIAELPSLPIPGGNAGAGLLAHLSVSKFVDHLPFHRQNKIFKRQGIEMAESTIGDWFSTICKLLQPLYDTLQANIIQSTYLQADETPIPVLSRLKKNATHRGYYWVYHSPVEKLVFFDYRQGRGREGPESILENFTGSLQTDGYAAYEKIGQKQGIIHLGCMAHIRRKFDQVLKNDAKRANYVMQQIGLLYDIERTARDNDYSYTERYKLRQKEAISIINKLEGWFIENQPEVLPKSKIGEAINYAISMWGKIKNYTLDGRYEIDNNQVENTIRPVALGRKNYMFAGSNKGAVNAAMMYSFFGSCKKNDINPYQWLKYILEVIPDWKASKLDQLIPGNISLPTQL